MARSRSLAPSADPETALAARLGGPVAGVDEAGRGPWAGPVVAAAVVLDPAATPEGLNDSKRLSIKRRGALLALLEGSARVGIGRAEAWEIDRDGINAATDRAMLRALDALPGAPAAVLVDGLRLPRGLALPGEALKHGDGLSLSVAAASIVAKVTRDRLMAVLAEAHPGYGWETNRGYGTAAHRAGLERLGVAPPHRRSFRPVAARLTRA